MTVSSARTWGWRTAASALLLMTACGQAATPSPPANAAAAAQPARTVPAPRSIAASDEAINFALGNVLFILFHELGHALIAEFELPVLGREEDAVDIFASVFLSPDANDPQADASILTDAIAGWFAYAETALEEIEYWEVHGPNRQRAYQIACLLYGSNAGAYDGLAEQIGLPPDRRESCDEDYQAAYNSWGRLLADHVIQNGGQPGAQMTVRYDDATGFEAERDMLRNSGIMEALATEMGSAFRLPRAITIKGARCDKPNAFWNPQAAEITVCYELVRDYVQVHQALSQ